MAKTFKTKISNLPIIALAIIFIFSALLITSCDGIGTDKPAAAPVDSTKNSFKILGAWVSADDPANKAVFTADSLTTTEGSKASETAAYKWISEQEIELTDKKHKATIAVDGDILTMTVDGKAHKLIREGANITATTVTPANTDTSTANQPTLTPEAKVYQHNLINKWADNNYVLEFLKDTVKFYRTGQTKPYNTSTYLVVSENNLDLIQLPYNQHWKASMKIEDEGNKLIWEDHGRTFNFKKVKTD